MHYIIWQCIHGYNSCIKHINHRTACHITKPNMWIAILPQSDPGSVSDRSEPSERSEGPASPKKATSTEAPRDSMNRTVDVVGNVRILGWIMILVFCLFGKDVLFGKVNGWRFMTFDSDGDLDIGGVIDVSKLWQDIQEFLSASIPQLLIWFFSVSWKETCVTVKKEISK